MKVFIVTNVNVGDFIDSTTIIGVYSNRKDAQKVRKFHASRHMEHYGLSARQYLAQRGEHYEIEVHKINS